MTAKWTREDEQTLRALQKRRKEVQDATREPLTMAAAGILRDLSGLLRVANNGYTQVVLCDALIEHAGQLRDALAPFDSGVRPE